MYSTVSNRRAALGRRNGIFPLPELGKSLVGRPVSVVVVFIERYDDAEWTVATNEHGVVDDVNKSRVELPK